LLDSLELLETSRRIGYLPICSLRLLLLELAQIHVVVLVRRAVLLLAVERYQDHLHFDGFVGRDALRVTSGCKGMAPITRRLPQHHMHTYASTEAANSYLQTQRSVQASTIASRRGTFLARRHSEWILQHKHPNHSTPYVPRTPYSIPVMRPFSDLPAPRMTISSCIESTRVPSLRIT